MTHLWNKFNINASQKWICWGFSEEKRNLHGRKLQITSISKKTKCNILKKSRKEKGCKMVRATSRAFISAGSMVVACIPSCSYSYQVSNQQKFFIVQISNFQLPTRKKKSCSTTDHKAPINNQIHPIFFLKIRNPHSIRKIINIHKTQIFYNHYN